MCLILLRNKQLYNIEISRTIKAITEVENNYKEEIGYKGTFYIASIGDGAREITEDVLA
jgi:galactokinase